MEKLTIISGTNRPQSYTQKVAKYYHSIFSQQEAEVKFLSLEMLPPDFLFSNTFGNRTKEFQELIDEYILASEKYIFILPEYNGSFPGILKGFLDAVPPNYWTNKKAALVGVAQGRAGNLRGIEQLTLVLNYLKVFVHHQKIPISIVDSLFDEKGFLFHEPTQKILNAQKEAFLRF